MPFYLLLRFISKLSSQLLFLLNSVFLRFSRVVVCGQIHTFSTVVYDSFVNLYHTLFIHPFVFFNMQMIIRLLLIWGYCKQCCSQVFIYCFSTPNPCFSTLLCDTAIGPYKHFSFVRSVTRRFQKAIAEGKGFSSWFWVPSLFWLLWHGCQCDTRGSHPPINFADTVGLASHSPALALAADHLCHRRAGGLWPRGLNLSHVCSFLGTLLGPWVIFRACLSLLSSESLVIS